MDKEWGLMRERWPRGAWTGMLLALVVGLAAPFWLAAVWTLGQYIPQTRLGADYLAAVVWAVVLGAVIYLAPVRSADRTALLLIWIAKSAVALGFALLYEFQYSELDAYGYFAYASSNGVPWNRFSLGDGTQNTMSLARLHSLLLPDSYHMLKVSWSLIGLAGVYLCYRGGVRIWGREDRRLLFALALFPSSIFWSSTFGKDSLCLLAVGLYVYAVTGWWYHRRARYVAIGLVGALFGAGIRLWLLPIFFAALFFLALAATRSRGLRALMLGAGLVGALSMVPLMIGALGFSSLDEFFKLASLAQEAMAEGGSGVDFSIDLSSPVTVLASLPLGMFTALFRPLPGDVMNAFGILAGLESLVLLGLVVLAAKRTSLRELRNPILVWIVALVVSWSVVYAFLSFNLGAAVRFRLQILPVLIFVLLYLARPRVPAARATLSGSDRG